MKRAIAAALLSALVTGGGPSRAAAQDDLELKVKAAFVYNFLKFVTWPPSRARSPSAPYLVCVVDGADFARILTDTVRDKDIEGRRVEVRAVSHGAALADCHVAYLPGVAAQPAEALLAAASGDVLTIHEADTAVPSGVIRFFILDNRVRLEINLTAAERRRLQLGSRLLGAAERVQVGP